MKRRALLLFAAVPLLHAAEPPDVSFHAASIAGWQSTTVDVTDRSAVLAEVWRRMPAEVSVAPSENYFYWQLRAQGRELRGNFRLASGRREKGIMNYGYSEWVEFPAEASATDAVLTSSGELGPADGVTVECPDRFSVRVTFQGKQVRFLLNQTGQAPPKQFQPGEGEVFIERTMDESGCAFFLMFNTRSDSFFWVLNEEGPPAETFRPLADGLVAGRRTGFIFWQQTGRKILTGVRRLSVDRNDYCDGPFDQLADNYAHETGLRRWIERAWPQYKGRIDAYGYFSGEASPKRIALNNYHHYRDPKEIVERLAQAKQSADPLAFLTRPYSEK